MIALDTNILVYARREEMPKHRAALAALIKLAEGTRPWALPIFSIGEFVRVVSHPRLFSPPTKPSAAMKFIAEVLRSPAARLLTPAGEYVNLFKQVMDDSGVSGNGVFDAQIAALCMENGVTQILTEDRDFLRFPALTVVTLQTFAAL